MDPKKLTKLDLFGKIVEMMSQSFVLDKIQFLCRDFYYNRIPLFFKQV